MKCKLLLNYNCFPNVFPFGVLLKYFYLLLLKEIDLETDSHAVCWRTFDFLPLELKNWVNTCTGHVRNILITAMDRRSLVIELAYLKKLLLCSQGDCRGINAHFMSCLRALVALTRPFYSMYAIACGGLSSPLPVKQFVLSAPSHPALFSHGFWTTSGTLVRCSLLAACYSHPPSWTQVFPTIYWCMSGCLKKLLRLT